MGPSWRCAPSPQGGVRAWGGPARSWGPLGAARRPPKGEFALGAARRAHSVCSVAMVRMSGYCPVFKVCAHFKHSLKPWISNNAPVTGMANLKGHVMGCHELLTKVSLVT